MSKQVISFILPVFRNEVSIRIACSRIADLFTLKHSSFDYEIVLISDRSDDGSWEEIREIA